MATRRNNKRKRGRPKKTTNGDARQRVEAVAGGLELTRADRAIAWIERFCVVPEGPDVGRAVVLRDWQKEILRLIYNNPAGTRRAIVSFARKNGKTSLVSFVMLLHLCGDEAVPNSNVYSAAQSREQAGILFSLAAKVIRLSPTLSAHVTIRDHAKELEFKQAGTKYRALSAEVATAFGLSPALVIHDELGQVRGNRSELYDALETATAAYAEPLSIIISTQAPNDGDLLSVLIDDALSKADPRTVIKLYTAPTEMDAFCDEAIRLANPAFGDFQNADEVRAVAQQAKRLSASESSFRNLYLNQRVATSMRFVEPAEWKACGAAPRELVGPVYGGLDLSSVNDLTACVLIGQADNVWQVHSTFWLPADGLHDRARKDRVPYDVWMRDGFIQTAPGKSVDYEFVAYWLREQFEKYDIHKIGFDRWNFQNLKAWLLRVGFTEEKIDAHFIPFAQGFTSMGPALASLKRELINGRLAHGMHPVLAMCSDNAIVITDHQNNQKLSKQKSIRRIDGLVALTMALGVVPLEGARPPKVELFML